MLNNYTFSQCNHCKNLVVDITSISIANYNPHWKVCFTCFLQLTQTLIPSIPIFCVLEDDKKSYQILDIQSSLQALFPMCPKSTLSSSASSYSTEIKLGTFECCQGKIGLLKPQYGKNRLKEALVNKNGGMNLDEIKALVDCKKFDAALGYHIAIRNMFPPYRIYTNNLVEYIQKLKEKETKPIWVIPSAVYQEAISRGISHSLNETIEADDALYFCEPHRLIEWYSKEELINVLSSKTTWNPDENFLEHRLDSITSVCRECEREAQLIKKIIRKWWDEKL